MERLPWALDLLKWLSGIFVTVMLFFDCNVYLFRISKDFTQGKIVLEHSNNLWSKK
jgi:hypothetical protein